MAEDIQGGTPDLLSSLRQEYGPIKQAETPENGSEDLLSNLRAEYGPADTSAPRSTLSEMGRQFGAGALDLGTMAGKAIQAGSEEGGEVYNAGKALREKSEAASEGLEPDLRGKGEVAKAFIHGTRAMIPSMAPAALYAVPYAGPALSTAATVGLFGGAQYQDTYEKLIGEGVPPEEAKKAALETAATQGAGEAVANRLTAGTLGAGKQVVAKTVGELTGQIAKDATLKEAAKKFGKAYAAELVGEPATEIAQDVGTEAIERAYGAQPSAEYGDIAYQSGTTALAMSLLMGIPGTGGHYVNAKRAEKHAALLDAGLNDPNTPEQTRIAAVNGVHQLAKRNGIADADQWRDSALVDIANGLPVGSVQKGLAAQSAAAPEVPTVTPEAPTATPEAQPVTPEVPTAEQPAEIGDDIIARERNYVDTLKARIADNGIQPTVTHKMRQVAQTFGVYDPELKPEEILAALDLKIADLENAQKTPGQKVAENIAGKGPISDMLAAVPDVLDANIAAKQAAAEEQGAAVQEEAPFIDATTGEILTEEKPQEENYYSPEALAAMDDITLQSLAGSALSGDRLAAVNSELLRRKEGGENALNIPQAGQVHGGGGEQPGLREEGRGPAVGGPGLPPSGQEIGNFQQEPSEAPISQEVANGESENQAAQETAAQEEVTEAGHPKYVEANSLAEAADITERNKAELPKDQIHKGDYQRGSAYFHGLRIAIENKAGSFRSGKDVNGKEWRQQMHSHYGEIVVRDSDGTLKTGADGDLVDVFVNPNPRIKLSPRVYIIDQMKLDKDGKPTVFDEHKVVLGYPSKAKARQAYLDNYEEGWQGIGAITEMPMPDFKNWLLNENSKLPVDPNVGKPKPEKAAPKEKIANRYQLTGNEELQKAVSKLGGIKLEGEIKSVFSEYKKRALFNNGANSKLASEAVEILQGLGYQIEDEHQLVAALESSLLYSSTGGQSGRPFYTPEGFEKFAERNGVAKEDEGKFELESRVKALLDSTKSFLGEADYEIVKRAADRGDITADNIAVYEDELSDDIAKLSVKKGYEPGPEDFLRGQDMRGANAPKPVAKPEITEDLFVADEAERQALERKQNLAAIERAKAEKRTGPVESELFTDITAQKDIEDIFEDLLPNKSKKVQDEAKAKLAENPNAERLQYVEDNFNTLLLELEQSGKVEIKC